MTDLRDKSNQIIEYLCGTGSETPHLPSPPPKKKNWPSFLYLKKNIKKTFSMQRFDERVFSFYKIPQL
jgi:hypothetical protein